MGNQAPLCLAMLLCDAINTDPSTGKATILGTFTTLTSTAFPAVHARLALFIELTDGRGETELVIKFCRVTADSIDGEELNRLESTVDFKDPRVVGRIAFGISNVVLPAEGEYRFILETKAGVHIAERRLVALRKP